VRELDRLDAVERHDADGPYSAHSPSLSTYVPSSTICIVAFRKTPSR
jgi:hypothetical protein